MSFSRIARTSRSADSVERSPSASDGPTPFAVSSRWKTRVSSMRREAEQLPGVFPHDEMRVQLDLLADARQRLVHAERDRELVGDAAGREDLHAVELLGDELAGKRD